MNVAAAIVQCLLLLFFLPAAVLKLAGHRHMREEFTRFRLPYALARCAGAVELLACLLLLAGFRQAFCAALGACLLVPVMIGASWINFTRRPPAFGWGTLVLLLVCAGFAAFCLTREMGT
ncbi:DoxX family protein [Solimonas terrae]|uniref:DoxX family membrane protein n=1 Tax=Solimonas terrae TaxID=1396819 RepID=A0A6M2BNS2_9GAMM|nr:DoxX family protein [Solimonas terrae]NGY04282.1 DoxX family membrane protein [Solimonas terrae]